MLLFYIMVEKNTIDDPSPNLQKTCRKIVEKGGDLVICQHTDL